MIEDIINSLSEDGIIIKENTPSFWKPKSKYNMHIKNKVDINISESSLRAWYEGYMAGKELTANNRGEK